MNWRHCQESDITCSLGSSTSHAIQVLSLSIQVFATPSFIQLSCLFKSTPSHQHTHLPYHAKADHERLQSAISPSAKCRPRQRCYSSCWRLVATRGILTTAGRESANDAINNDVQTVMAQYSSRLQISKMC